MMALGVGGVVCVALAFFYCGGEVDDPSTITMTKTTSVEVPTATPTAAATLAAAASPPPDPKKALIDAGGNMTNVGFTAAPSPQAPQPPCTSCPATGEPAPAPAP
jgi:hypothetical protein